VTAVAEAAQRVLLHPVLPMVGPLQVAVRYISASAAARIGGDRYEVIPARQAIRLIVPDVQGKGLAAVQTAALVLGAFREAAYDAARLADIAARIGRSLGRQAAAEEFVTAVSARTSRTGTAGRTGLRRCLNRCTVALLDPGLSTGRRSARIQDHRT
jgi:serine phosphatase RsbU (regulator of sigma subunit)